MLFRKKHPVVVLPVTEAADAPKALESPPDELDVRLELHSIGPDPIRDLRYRINELRHKIDMAWSMLEQMVQWNKELKVLEDELSEWYERAREMYARAHPL